MGVKAWLFRPRRGSLVVGAIAAYAIMYVSTIASAGVREHRGVMMVAGTVWAFCQLAASGWGFCVGRSLIWSLSLIWRWKELGHRDRVRTIAAALLIGAYAAGFFVWALLLVVGISTMPHKH
jgi:hypothetical protein